MKKAIFFYLCFMTLNATAQQLEGHRWKERLVILYSPGPEDPAYLEQVQELRREARGLQERKVLVYSFFPASYGKGLEWSEEKQSGTRQIDNFALELRGLDGGRKLYSEKIVTPQELFALIDRMPMRRREMDRDPN